MPVNTESVQPTAPRYAASVMLSVAAILCGFPRAAAADQKPKGDCYALLVGGMPGTDMHARRYRDWLARFHAYLTKTAGVPAGNVVLLSGDEGFKDAIVNGKATAESVRKAIADMGRKVKPADQFILFIAAHGGATDKSPTIVLPGDDLAAEDLAKDLESLAAGNQVILNFANLSGDGVQHLRRKNRVNAAATSPQETADPVYAEFFLRGLESGRADGEGAPAAGAKDGTVTILEAYNWGACQTAYWILRQKAEGEVWKLDGKESVEIFKKLYVGAARQTGTRKLSAESDGTNPDKIPSTLPTGGPPDMSLSGRRLVLEHAMLEDCGEERGVSALREKGYEPVEGVKEGEPGCLARRTVIGKAELLPAGRPGLPSSRGRTGATSERGGN